MIQPKRTTIHAKSHPKDKSPELQLILTEQQVYTLYRSLQELPIVLDQQYAWLHPEQKKYLKMAVRHLKKFRVLDGLSLALETCEQDRALQALARRVKP